MCTITGILRVQKGKKNDRLYYNVEGINVIPSEGSNPPTVGGFYRIPVSVVRKESDGIYKQYIFAAAFIPVTGNV